MQIDINQHPDIIATVNAILNNGGIAEVRNEGRRKGKMNLVVVEVKRTLKVKNDLQ